MINLEITENDSGQRLDRFLRKYFRNAPLSYIYKLIRTGVRVNGEKSGQSLILKPGDLVSVNISEEEAAAFLDRKPIVAGGVAEGAFAGTSAETSIGILSKEPLIKIVYEDENILVVDKPAGLLTHETREEKEDVLSRLVLAYLIREGMYSPEKERVFKPAPANRLDRNTSGLVVFGKNSASARSLAKMFREKGLLDRYYQAYVYGEMKGAKVLLGLTEKDGKQQHMETHVKVLEAVEDGPDGPCTLVEAMLVTGRTHQIRKQLAEEGHPVVGDRRYGLKMSGTKGKGFVSKGAGTKHRLFLHGWKLVFNDCPPPLEYLKGVEVKSDMTLMMLEDMK